MHDDDKYRANYNAAADSNTETLYEKELPVLCAFCNEEGAHNKDTTSGKARYLEVSKVKQMSCHKRWKVYECVLVGHVSYAGLVEQDIDILARNRSMLWRMIHQLQFTWNKNSALHG
jgi:hypothetical protein